MKKYKLNSYAGKKQQIILNELFMLAEITQCPETGLWRRGALTAAFAKDLLSKEDRPIQQLIDDLEQRVLSLELEAKKSNIKLSGGARARLDKLIEKKKTIYK